MRPKKTDISHPGKKLKEVVKILFDQFSKNLLKKNAEKCHLILSSYESFPINTDNEVFKNSNDKRTVWSEFE